MAVPGVPRPRDETFARSPTITGRSPATRALFSAVTLFFTVVPLIGVLQHRPGPVALVLLLAGWAVFGLVLLQLFRFSPFGGSDDTSFLLFATVFLAVDGVVTQVLLGSGESAALYYYAGVTAARLVPERRARLAIAGVAALAGLGTASVAGDTGGGLVVAVTVGTISLTLSALSSLGRANRELQAARLELAEVAVAEERVRIARDLHDTLGHTLSLIALKSELARRVIPTDPARAADEIADVERAAREALASVRDTVGGYRQASLSMELARARSALHAAGIEATVEPAPEGLPREVDALLGWAVREGVTNVMRHSRARSARIRLVADGQRRGVEILDDGDGPGEGEAHRDGRGPGGFGLAGLRERAGQLGGVVDAGTRAGGGFRLFVSVPVVDGG